MTVQLRDIAESEGTAPRALALADALDIPSQPGASASMREMLRVGSVPRFRPERWNDDLFDLINNNCYNYGADVLNDKFGQPGWASGVIPTALECSQYTPAAVSDGLISTGSEPTVAGVEFGHVVALVIADGPDELSQDFHWYRRDRNGMWSHKRGSTEATNLDAADRPISDPRSADRRYGRLDYRVFCGFFCVPRGAVSIDGAGPKVERPPATATAEEATIVQLLVYSGRPNPEWVVEAGEEAAIVAKLSAARRGTRLTAAARRRSRDSYQGFLIDRPGATPGTRDVTIVRAGVVGDVRLTGAEVARADADGLEDELLEQARRRGFRDLL